MHLIVFYHHFGCSIVLYFFFRSHCRLFNLIKVVRFNCTICFRTVSLHFSIRFHFERWNEAITLSAVQELNVQCRLVAVNEFDLINNNRITITIIIIIRNDDWIGRMARADSDLITRASIFWHIDSESYKSKFSLFFFCLLLWSTDVIYQHHFPMPLTASRLERHLYHFWWMPKKCVNSVGMNLTVLVRKSRTASLCDVRRCAQNHVTTIDMFISFVWHHAIPFGRTHNSRSEKSVHMQTLAFYTKASSSSLSAWNSFDDNGYMRKFPNPYLVQFWHFACVWRKFLFVLRGSTKREWRHFPNGCL